MAFPAHRGRRAAWLIVLLAVSPVWGGCARSSPHSSVSSPGVVSAESPAAVYVPGTGILSHEREEREIPRKAVVLSGVRLPVVGLPDADGDAPALRSGRPSRPDSPRMLPFPQPAAIAGLIRGKARSDLPARRAAPPEWKMLADEAADIFGLDAGLILAVIRVESAFNRAAESPAGAQGAMQVMPATQEELGLIDPFDPRANVYAGSQYLMRLLQRFGSVELALAAYNAGPASVEKYGGMPPFAETRDFVREVMRHWKTGT